MTKIASPSTVLREISGPDACEMCGTTGLKTELVRDPFIYGSGDQAVELVIDIPVHTCLRCEMSFTSAEAEQIEHDAVCRHLGLLAPTEIRGLREQYGVSRAAFARVTGLGDATLARWERGDVMQNRANDRYLRLLRDPEVMRKLELLASEGDSASQDRTARAAFGRPSRQSIAEKTKALPAHKMDRLRNEGTEFSPTPGHAA